MNCAVPFDVERLVEAPSSYGQVHFATVVEQQADKKTEPTITGAKIAMVGTIVAAIIGATATITVALLQRKDSSPAPETSPTATPEIFSKKVLDESALEGDNGVRKVLIGSYGVQADQIQSVDCPAGQEVEPGNKFTCTVQLGRDNPGEKIVDITIRDANGEYEVGAPRNS